MTSEFFQENRQQLAMLLASNYTVLSLEQPADFWYLTGIEEPGWQLVVEAEKDESWLIAPEIDEISRVFDGGLGFEAAQAISGVAKVVTSAEGRALLRNLKKKAGKKEISKAANRLRSIKQPVEIETIKSAVAITIQAIERVRKEILSYDYEYKIEADIGHQFRWSGAKHAFDPIVAHGGNACTLHYAKNESMLSKDGLLLIDVGARSNGYAADITRTVALSDPTHRQQAVHGAVQHALQEIAALLRPNVLVKEYVLAADTIMRQALVSLDLMKNMDDDKSFRRYFPHAISHGLGIEVHESLGGYKTFQPGMVLTVEPGIYIPEEGIGVRIEDDILITDDGCLNMTASLSTDL